MVGRNENLGLAGSGGQVDLDIFAGDLSRGFDGRHISRIELRVKQGHAAPDTIQQAARSIFITKAARHTQDLIEQRLRNHDLGTAQGTFKTEPSEYLCFG